MLSAGFRSFPRKREIQRSGTRLRGDERNVIAAVANEGAKKSCRKHTNRWKHAEHAEHAAHSNRKVALVIAILALFLFLLRDAGKERADRSDRRQCRGLEILVLLPGQDRAPNHDTHRHRTDETHCRSRLGSGDQSRDGETDRGLAKNRRTLRIRAGDPRRPQGTVAERAKEAEESRDTFLAKYHAYEIASATFQIGIVLASAAVITEIIALAWLAGLLGAGGLAVMVIGFFAPHVLHHYEFAPMIAPRQGGEEGGSGGAAVGRLA